jgi:chemotaxis protein MotA
MIAQLMDIGEAYVKEGNKGMEQAGEKARNSFLKKALVLVEEGNKAQTINTILRRDIANFKERHKTGQNILAALGTYAPAFGMIGTLMGLIQMLRNLSDPSQIGYGMSVALLTTFYGAVFANLVCNPLAEKLKDRSKDESTICELITEGVVAIVSGAKKRELQNRLIIFLNQKSRKKFEK